MSSQFKIGIGFQTEEDPTPMNRDQKHVFSENTLKIDKLSKNSKSEEIFNEINLLNMKDEMKR